MTMAEQQRTCGECKWYKPAINPDTNRVQPSQPGRCEWPEPKVEWPISVLRLHNHRILSMGRIHVHRWTQAEDCKQWNPKKSLPKSAPVQKELNVSLG